ncbi:TPA: serine hydroxymethyltransferase [Candidatus Woesearchaeota archaeon]|nr:serine hydroxymethyltransferase [archaeon]HIJ10782.1 serine hydroxymethyltransferase [Candidatus Woesearchaeota archaeon]|tara:strand:+ start:101 stop:1405 length:1305 start_codon:yes stop_codon:yes gene_type:complete
MKTIQDDPRIYELMRRELTRQQTTINLIPSENFVSEAVLDATGSVLTNKYSEGYPHKRYYQGQANVDEVETIAIERAKRLFGAEHVNVQSYSGSPANLAIFHALCTPGDTILGMRLDMGGHLTHGHKVNASAKFFNSVQYSVNRETGLIDMQEVRKLAREHRPTIIIAGCTAYPQIVDFAAFRKVAEEVGAYLLADISHIAGLVAAGVHPSPFPHADVVMTTTHKTLRGPRGAMIMCTKLDRLANVEGLDEKKAAKARNLASKIDRAVFPGMQGGPHENVIAAKAVAFKEALSPEFKEYGAQIVRNAKALATTLQENGIKLVTNGTENHLLLLDLLPFGVGLGRQAAVALENAGIVTNCNTVPYDPSTPFKPSGVRIGTPMVTSKGMKEGEMRLIGTWMAMVIKDMKNTSLQHEIREKVWELCEKFPLYSERKY